MPDYNLPIYRRASWKKVPSGAIVVFVPQLGKRFDKHIGNCRLRENNKWYCEFYPSKHHIEVATLAEGQRWIISHITAADVI